MSVLIEREKGSTVPFVRGEKRSSLKKREKQLKDFQKNFESLNVVPQNEQKRPKSVSRDDRARLKFSHSVYDKAAIMFEQLNEGKMESTSALPEFETEFEKRRAYSLAFAAKRYEVILKDVLLDSSFYSRYFKLETFHHTKVIIMLLDFYEHGFRFSEKKRCQIAHSANFLSHIDEIQKAFFDQKIKICSAFARNRIKACALTLEGLLPPEVKERGECGARHPLYARVNTLVTDREAVIHTLKNDGFEMVTDISAVKEERLVEEDELEVKSCFAIDQDFDDLLLFPSYLKDDVYNHDLALDCRLIPQSKPRYIAFELTRRKLAEISNSRKKAEQLLSNAGGLIMPDGDDVVLTDAETGSLAAHLCSIVHPRNKLIICSCPSNKRDEIEKRLRKMGATNFQLLTEKFVDISPTDQRFSESKIVVCNPPSTNSGVVNPVDFILHEGADVAQSLYRLSGKGKSRSYAGVQKATLVNAIRIPAIETVLYCNFSINKEETEDVMQTVLEGTADSSNKEGQFELCGFMEKTSPSFYSRCNTEGMADSGQITLAPSSEMDGFYVACLERKVKEDSVKEIMERANKKGLLKKKEKSVKRNVQGSKSPKPCPKSSTKHQLSPKSDRKSSVSGEDHARFRF